VVIAEYAGAARCAATGDGSGTSRFACGLASMRATAKMMGEALRTVHVVMDKASWRSMLRRHKEGAARREPARGWGA
jgi:hypothetical protein